MLLPLLCALLYTALSTPVLADARVGLNDVQSEAALSLRAYGLSLRFDGVIERVGTRLQLRYTPRYGRRALGERTLRARLDAMRGNGWMLRAAMRGVRVGQLDAYLRVGTDEAWSTALIAGAVRSLAASLLAVTGGKAPCDVRVDAAFDRPGFLLTARCIFSAAPGDIMFAVAKEAVKKTQREGFKWLSIPLKA